MSGPNQGTDSPADRCYSVRREDPSADAGWEEIGVSPPGHLSVSNQELYCMADDVARHSPFDWDGASLFCDGKRFAYGLRTPDVFEDVGGQEALCIGLLVHTSYDGSWPTGGQLFAYRPVSTSGLLHSGHFEAFRFRRPLTSDAWAQELERACGSLDGVEKKLQQFGQVAHSLKRRAISSTDLATLRRGPLAQWPTPLWGQMLDRYLGGTSRTAWDLLTRGSALLWNDNEQPRRARDFRYNQALTEGIVGSVTTEGQQPSSPGPWLQ
ncbi:DUF932 domain-containing protein [Salinibacter altiplanensis]|uniref:DUF932 domain-containing protein n=1 Tax=Salinibacter altiplanensis TaxID=1803181 RepID=UPI00131A13DF|nr:DUF932 domain-containing protein [Salinibacter altiplanensis]